jgi:hypothetical protein
VTRVIEVEHAEDASTFVSLRLFDGAGRFLGTDRRGLPLDERPSRLSLSLPGGAFRLEIRNQRDRRATVDVTGAPAAAAAPIRVELHP